MVRRALLACCTFLLAGSLSSNAAIVYNSGGFEPLRFVPGPLTGQDPTFGPWLQSGAGTANVQMTVVLDGLQAVQVNRTGADVRWGVVKPTTAPEIIINWDMRVEHTALPPGSFGPFFGVEAYAPGIQLIGSAGLDAATGEVLYQEGGTGIFVAPGQTVAFGTWHDYQLRLNFGTQQYSIFVDNALIATTAFVDPGITSFSDADLSALAAAGDPISQTALGTAYYDNFSVTAVTAVTAVPEPSSVLLMLAGFAVLILRSKRVPLLLRVSARRARR